MQGYDSECGACGASAAAVLTAAARRLTRRGEAGRALGKADPPYFKDRCFLLLTLRRPHYFHADSDEAFRRWMERIQACTQVQRFDRIQRAPLTGLCKHLSMGTKVQGYKVSLIVSEARRRWD